MGATKQSWCNKTTKWVQQNKGGATKQSGSKNKKWVQQNRVGATKQSGSNKTKWAQQNRVGATKWVQQNKTAAVIPTTQGENTIRYIMACVYHYPSA